MDDARLEELIEDTIQYLSHTLTLDAAQVKAVSGIIRVSLTKAATTGTKEGDKS